MPLPPDLPTASDYLSVYQRLWPIAVTGGFMGVVVHAPQIMRSKSRASAAFLAVSEWTVGAAGAMFLAMVAPEIMSRFVPDYVFTSPAAELGLYGFLGGSFGRGMFRALVSVSYRLFYRAVGVDGRGWDGKTDRRKGA